MKKWLLYLVVCGSIFSAQSQSYKTVHCHDECKYIYCDTMAYYSVDYDDDFKYKKHLWTDLKMGLYRFGELLSVDTTNALGYIELDIPDMQETDIYNLILFYEYKRIYGCSFGGRGYQLDTNYFQSDNGWIAHHIICKEHGRMSDSSLVNSDEMKGLSIDVFPIPTSEQLTLRFSQPFSGICSILQLSGIQAQSMILNNQENYYVDVSGLSGTYIMVVYDENGTLRERKKIVVL